MDRFPNATALREARRIQKLGGVPSVCAFCGYAGRVILVTLKWLEAHRVPIPKELLEKHHPGGKNHQPNLTIPLCRNCHAECTENLLRAGVSMRRAVSERESIALSLEAEALFFEDYAKAQRQKAARVRGLGQ
jgi:hypothetical protein